VVGAVLWAGSRGGGGEAPLRVTSLAVTVTPSAGRCPSATFTFTGRVGTQGGAGEITAAWTRPDGTTEPAFQLPVGKGGGQATAVLTVAVTGSRPLRGSAVLRLLSPVTGQASSPRVAYTC
jgi:hypothetical protein